MNKDSKVNGGFHSLQASEELDFPEQKILLHVGSGPKNPKKVPDIYKTAEWREIRLDINPAANPDILGDIRHMKQVASNSVDVVLSSHNLEHLYPHEASMALAEFFRVLKPAGAVSIACPDLLAIAEFIVQGNLTEPIYTAPAGPVSPLDMLYGFRPSLAQGDLYMAHKSGFTAETLFEALTEAGFAQIQVESSGMPLVNLQAHGTKPDGDL